MKIRSAILYRYRLPLARTLILRNQPHIYREGFLLSLENETGHIGWGEIAPLPGHSRESMQDVQTQATALVNAVIGCAVPESLAALSTAPKFNLSSLVPSVRCGLEAAILHLHAESENRAVRFAETSPSNRVAPLNGLLAGDDAAMLERVTLLTNQGYRSIKLKLGQRTVDEDIALTYRIHARIDGKATLRLDANRSWTYEQAMIFGKTVDVIPVEYIEEPLQDAFASRLPELAREWTLPIALDETLVASEPSEIQDFDRLAAFVLKPTLLGGFSRACEYVARARKLKIKTVISSSFESAVGLAMLGHFVSQVAPDTPCGLDTSEWMKENLLERPLPVLSGQMVLDQSRTLPTDVNLSLLTEVGRG